MNIKLESQDILKLSSSDINGVILFGSQAQGLANQNSDLDIFILGKRSNTKYDLIYDIFSNKAGRLINIDIVFEDMATMELMVHVARHGKVLYQKNINDFANFKAKVMILASDFDYHKQIYTKEIFNKI